MIVLFPWCTLILVLLFLGLLADITAFENVYKLAEFSLKKQGGTIDSTKYIGYYRFGTDRVRFPTGW
jgi:hypothetical protein